MNERSLAIRRNGGRRSPSSAAVAWRGASVFDGAPVQVVVYCLNRGSLNRKLGPMAQVLICPSDVPPHGAARQGTDVSVCGSCPLRPANGGGCYVNLGAYFPRVWEISTDHPADLDEACEALRRSGLTLRVGSWGDPAAVPLEVVQRLVDAARGEATLPRHTAYTAAWRSSPGFRRLAMASVLTEVDQREATAAGWRSFRVRHRGDPVLPNEMVCPASEEAGKKTTCSECLACGGAGRRGPNVVVEAHGSRNKLAAIEKMLHDGTGPQTRAQGKHPALDAEGGLRGSQVGGPTSARPPRHEARKSA